MFWDLVQLILETWQYFIFVMYISGYKLYAISIQYLGSSVWYKTKFRSQNFGFFKWFQKYVQYESNNNQLEQLERLRSEDTPRRPV